MHLKSHHHHESCQDYDPIRVQNSKWFSIVKVKQKTKITAKKHTVAEIKPPRSSSIEYLNWVQIPPILAKPVVIDLVDAIDPPSDHKSLL